MQKLIGILFFAILCIAVSASAAEIQFNPSWVLLTKDGRSIDIRKLSTAVDKKNNVHLIYTTTSGKEGSMPASNLKNDQELIAAIETAMDNRKAVYEQPYKPARNRVPSGNLSRSRSSSSGAVAIIERNCREKWKEDYEMIEYCINNQKEALANVRRMSGPILQRCKEKWGHDYEMVEYCTNNQTAAKNRLEGRQ